jgi:hypothetical protein
MTCSTLDEVIAATALANLSIDPNDHELVLQGDLALANLIIMRQGCFAQGFKEGFEKGRREALREELSSIVALLALPNSEAVEAKLNAMDANQLESLMDYLGTHRTWPEGW